MKKAIVYEVPGADPRRDLIRRKDLTIVAISEPGELLAVTADLVAEGVALIELCGGVSPRWRPVVSAAAGPGVRVSSVSFGIESLLPAARFNQAYLEGHPPAQAFLFLEAGADPSADRFTRTIALQHTIFVPLPDEADAPAVARELAARGIGLIELYGGFTSAGAGAVIDAVDARAPVGVGGFTLEATLPCGAAA